MNEGNRASKKKDGRPRITYGIPASASCFGLYKNNFFRNIELDNALGAHLISPVKAPESLE